MSKDDLKKEREIMVVMRKVLAAVIKDTTPEHRSMKHPLSAGTIEDVRLCLGLIAAKERELADEPKAAMQKPYFTDDVQAVKTVSIDSIKKKS